MKITLGKRILERIATQGNCTNRAMLAADLGLSPKTVNRYVERFITLGAVERSFSDGVEALQITVDEQKDRALDALVKRSCK